MAEEKDDWLDDFDSPGDKAAGSVESDFETLLSDAGDQKNVASTPAASDKDELELDQSAIDALMSGSDEGQAASEPSASAGATSELDQSDIDSLLASPKNPVPDKAAVDPDQDEIDKLFSEVDSGGSAEEPSFPAEEIDFKDVFDSPDSTPQKNLNLDFDAEEFKLDVDIPDIPDTHGVHEPEAPPPPAAAVAAEPTAKNIPEPAPAEAKESATGQQLSAKGPGLLHNRKLLAGLGATLVLLCAASGIYFVKGRVKTAPKQETTTAVTVPQPPVAQPHTPAVTHTPPPPAPEPQKTEPEPTKPQNATPTVADLELTMPPESSQLTIPVKGSDPENDPLHYVMSLPEHGQLSGQPPNLIYIPKPDLDGRDCFIIRASDGKNISPPATVTISRKLPEGAKEAVAAVSATTPKPEAAPPEPGKAEKPVLCPPPKEDQSQPKPELVPAKKRSSPLSGSKQSKTAGARKNRAPVIQLQPVASIYLIGDTVVLSAMKTSDERRAALTFHWTQLSGAPILIKPLNREGSQISFVVPSAFSQISTPTVLINVTATDEEGVQDSKDVTITAKSRRESALWRGQH